MRINARLDEDLSQKMNYVSESTGLTVSDCVKKGVTLLYQEVRKSESNPLKVLERNKFIGSGKGPENLSKNYKDYLSESLNKKHDHR